LSPLSAKRQAVKQQLASYRQYGGLQKRSLSGRRVASGLLSTYTGVQLVGIVQEALTNVRKSSGASRVRVVVCSNDADVSILVEDNGCGFDYGTEQRAGITDCGS
jgi:nitrate/nitrite-specific signal transduction histidine kinase